MLSTMKMLALPGGWSNRRHYRNGKPLEAQIGSSEFQLFFSVSIWRLPCGEALDGREGLCSSVTMVIIGGASAQ